MIKIPRGYVDRLLKEAYTAHNTSIEILKYQANTRPSNIYGETIGKTYGAPITVAGYLEMNPTALRLQDLGWDKETVEFVAKVPFILLLEAGLANQDGTYNFSTDDKVRIPHLNMTYQLFKHQGREPFINGQPSYVWICGRKFTNGR